jgi:type-F conjugative transfer system mating-pair stabilization protein TraN
MTMAVATVQAQSLSELQKEGESFGREMAHRQDFSNRQDVIDTIAEMQNNFQFDAPSEENLNEEAVKQLSSSESAQFALGVIQNNPAWQITKDDPLWQRGKGIEKCDLSNTEQVMCEEGATKHNVCLEEWQVKVEPQAPVSFELNVYAASYAEKETHFAINLATGTLAGQAGAQSAHGWSSPALSKYSCKDLKFQYLGWSFWHDATLGGSFHTGDVTVTGATTPICSDNLITRFTLNQGHHKRNKWKNRGVIQRFKVTYQPPALAKTKKIKSCSNGEKTSCQTVVNKICLSKGETKLFSGIPVTQNCWKEQVAYSCPVYGSSCDSLRQKGCQQLSRICIKKDSQGACLKFKTRFECGQVACDGKVAQKPEGYCADGDCFTPTEEQLEGMEEGLSELSAVFSGGAGFDGDTIFKGTPMFCRKQGLGFNDCCKDKGWGQDLSLTGCNEGEKSLAMGKEAKRIVPVGEFCSKKAVGGLCLEKKKSYCAYPSKLARILQVGAHNQLNISLGDADNPICTGVSPGQLQALDLEKVDFSDFYQDIKAKDISKSLSHWINNAKARIHSKEGKGE